MIRNYIKTRINWYLNGKPGKMEQYDKSFRDHLKYAKELVPPLSWKGHKGECGRIGVIGGSAEYTGAPYYAAMTSLKVGADVAYIICCKEAAVPIKSYSPELIVYPYLDHNEVISKTASCLDRIHSLVIGPGMGRAPDVIKNVKAIINYCNFQMSSPIPLVFDADGLFLLKENLNVIQNYRGLVVLTPNSIEYARLCDKMGMVEKQLVEISRLLNVIILQKGEFDYISNGVYQRMLQLPPDKISAVNKVSGSVRRCAGQGDILAGCVATFVTWHMLLKKRQLYISWNDIFNSQPPPNFRDWSLENREETYNERLKGLTAACYAASLVTRQSSLLAFNKFGRGMTASDVLQCIPNAFNYYFG